MSRFGNVVFAGLAAAAVVSAFAFAQGGRGSAPTTAATSARPTYLQDVRPILQGRCVSCHNLKGIGPFKLTTYRDAVSHRFEIAAAVTRRIMPPWPAARGYKRFRFDYSLTDDQIGVLRRWVAQGARKGDPARPGRALPRVSAPVNSRPDLRLALPAPYTPTSKDDYRCFVLPWTPDRPRYVTEINVKPTQPSEVHHLAVVILGSADAEIAERLDALDSVPGYPCFGAALADGISSGEGTSRVLGGWLPGLKGGGPYPKGTGVLIPPGSRLFVQMHYNIEHTKAKPDRTVIELALADRVARRAAPLNLGPERPDRLQIPPGRKNYVFSYAVDLARLSSSDSGGLDPTRGLRILAVVSHMHLLGTRSQIAIVRTNGTSEILLSIPRWDFRWQLGYYFERPVFFAPGDKLTVRCEFDNSRLKQPLHNGVRQPPRLVGWGVNSSDEMCNAFLYVTEP